MERELWPVLYRTVVAVARDVRQKYVQIPASALLLTLLWAALHDRPVSWACRASNWDTPLRPPRLPSPATMSRRVDGLPVGWLWRMVEDRLRGCSAEYPALLAVIDGKPLPVGGCSKDPDAGYGRAAGTMARGYKLHAVWSSRAVPEAWAVTPMNGDEKAQARGLIPQLRHGGYLLGDAAYDAGDLFDRAARQGYQLVTPLPARGTPGGGHRPLSPARRRSFGLMWNVFGRTLFRERKRIERWFGNATAFGGGLAPLPAWVRGLDRVRTWVWAKLCINAARILTRPARPKD